LAWTARLGGGSGDQFCGIAVVGLGAAIAAQSWFDPGRLLAGGDVSPVVVAVIVSHPTPTTAAIAA
jgi:hypothetical protein